MWYPLSNYLSGNNLFIRKWTSCLSEIQLAVYMLWSTTRSAWCDECWRHEACVSRSVPAIMLVGIDVCASSSSHLLGHFNMHAKVGWRPDVDIDFGLIEGQTARRRHRFWCQRRTDSQTLTSILMSTKDRLLKPGFDQRRGLCFAESRSHRLLSLLWMWQEPLQHVHWCTCDSL